MWRVFMDKGDFRAALLQCRTPRQRNAVNLAQGEALFEEGDYAGAAALFGKVGQGGEGRGAGCQGGARIGAQWRSLVKGGAG